MNTTLIRIPDENTAPAAPDFSDLLPSLIGAYRNHSYEAGYARGRSDVRVAILESLQEFCRQRRDLPTEARRSIEEFFDFVEQRIQKDSTASDQSYVDGLGI